MLEVGILAELAENINDEKLAVAAAAAPVACAQRLGYLLTLAGAAEKTVALEAFVRKTARQSVLLSPGAPRENVARDRTWKLYPNAEIEAELLP